jgi:hypothetical protein
MLQNLVLKITFWTPHSQIMKIKLQSRDSTVGIATSYGLDDQGVGVQVPVGQEFSLLHVV